MGKRLSRLGWLIFVFALVGAYCRTGPDDPMTAAMKTSGAYEPVITTILVLTAFVALGVIWQMRRTVKLARKLEGIKRKRMHFYGRD